MNSLKWDKEKLKLLPLFDEDGVFCRAGNLKYAGDSPTDMGAMGLLDGRISAKYFKACQNSEGRMFRHPSRLDTWRRLDFANGAVEPEICNFSRDHLISLVFGALWSKNPELQSVCRSFLWFILKNKGRMCPGPVGQSMVNLGALAALLMAIGGMFWVLGSLLYLLYLPWLLVAVNFTERGYKLILCVEHAVLMFRFGIAPYWAVAPIFRKAFKTEPKNLFYEFWACKGLSSIGKIRLKKMWENWKPYCGKYGWAFTEAGRPGTGVDILYLMKLSGVLK
jgi:hypothetical protein